MLEFDFGMLRQLRKKKKMQQKDVAEIMHRSVTYVSKTELGIGRVYADDLARLADIYGVKDMNMFFAERIG